MEIKETNIYDLPSNLLFNEKILNEKIEVYIEEIFPKVEGEETKKTKIKRVSTFNFTSLIKEKVKEELETFIDFDVIENYNINNFAIVFKNEHLNVCTDYTEFCQFRKILFIVYYF